MTELVGIVNVTPDSFSDGGMFVSRDAALGHIDRLIDEGAAVIDIGAESTRPGALPLFPAEEWARLAPILPEAIARCEARRVACSIDTRHPATAAQALAQGAHWINDVSGFCDPEIIKAVQESSCKLVVMHALSVPADPARTLAEACDPVEAVFAFAAHRIAALTARGIAASRIVFDPGIGFGKTASQSRALIDGMEIFHALGVKLLVGHSRKSFLGADPSMERRDAATLAISQELARKGVQYLRVHNVALHRSIVEPADA